MNNIIRLTTVLLSVLLLFGCVTHKKKGDEKVSWIGKRYHNMTSRFNYWFNANELINTTTAKLTEQHKDNYSQILALYPYCADDPQPVRADLDNVIKKAATAISLHRPSDWKDDCYLLIGQAQYLKKDFETAEATFQFIKDEYDPAKKIKKAKTKKAAPKKKLSKRKAAKLKKKKKRQAAKKKKASKGSKSDKDKKTDKNAAKTEKNKKEEAPKKDEPPKPSGDDPYKKGLFSRRSAFHKSMVWFGRTMIEREKYEEAEYLFSELWADPYLPDNLKDDLASAEAYNWLQQKKYDRAIAPLQKALSLTKKKRERARIAYILAQLHDRSGDHEKAFAAYETVIKSGPAYEMEFNARLHQIESAWENSKITGKEADKTLSRMLKDSKNNDYRDQIYFTLASIALKDGMKKEAIAYLRQSLDASKENTTQRAESYLKLADLYFEAENFVNAKNYYDSTLTVLPPLDERFKRAENYSKNLTDIAAQIEIIAANDSIVNIYKMTPSERRDFAKKLKKQQEEEADAAAAKLAANATDKNKPPALPGVKVPPVAGSTPSSFYFYSDEFVKKGKKEFNKTWGSRKLTDNWRRSQRRTGQDTPDDGAIAAADSTQNSDQADASLDDFFKGIPKSETELAVLNLATYEAMFKLGTLFRENLQNNRKCASTLETLQARYPEIDKLEKETWYNCYLAYTDLNNTPKATEYLNKLVGKYPNSPYTRSINDPSFLNSQNAKEKELNAFYESSFEQFKKGNYKTAFDNCQLAPQKYGSTNTLMPKFALLSALCTGNLKGTEAYCQALTDVIGRFPDSPESTRAKEIARLLGCKGFEVANDPTKKNADEIDDKFVVEEDKLHYFMVYLDNAGGDLKIDDVKSAVSDFNRQFYKTEQLRISNIFLGTDTEKPIIVIRKFDNQSAAMKYLKDVQGKTEFLGESAKKTYKKEFFVITQENYRRVLKNKTLDGYREFFDEKYKK